MLKFLPIHLRYNNASRTVSLKASCPHGNVVDVAVTHEVVAYLTGKSNFSQDDAFTAVVRNKVALERAADCARGRQNDAQANIELCDLTLSNGQTTDCTNGYLN